MKVIIWYLWVGGSFKGRVGKEGSRGGHPAFWWGTSWFMGGEADT